MPPAARAPRSVVAPPHPLHLNSVLGTSGKIGSGRKKAADATENKSDFLYLEGGHLFLDTDLSSLLFMSCDFPGCDFSGCFVFSRPRTGARWGCGGGGQALVGRQQPRGRGLRSSPRPSPRLRPVLTRVWPRYKMTVGDTGVTQAEGVVKQSPELLDCKASRESG